MPLCLRLPLLDGGIRGKLSVAYAITESRML